MGKDADQVQTQCGTCQLAADREESYVVFISEDWRIPFMQYRCLLQMGYYWPTMKKDATEFVKKCHSCQV